MSITPLPTPPSRQDPINFADRADEFLGALPAFATQANGLEAENAAAATAAAQAVLTSKLDSTNPSYTGTLTGGTGVVNLGSGQFYKAADGSVGVGTSSPATNLHVKGATNGWLTLQRGNDASNIAWQSWANADGSNKWGLGMLNSSNNLSVFNYSTGDVAGVFDSAGNFGLNVTPSAWGSGFKALEVGRVGSGLFSVGATSMQVTCNYYYNGSNYIYASNGSAARYHLVDGQHQWLTAPAGTSGNPISFTQAMTLDGSGNLSTTSQPMATYGDNVRFLSTGATSGLSLGDSGSTSGYITIGSSGNAMTFKIGAAEVARFSAGNFGLGTASPTGKLDIDSGGAGKASHGLRINHAANAGYSVIDAYSAYGDGGGGDLLKIANFGGTKLLLNPAGNFGLGVTPSAWGTARKALQVGQASIANSTAANDVFELSANRFLDSGPTDKYIGNGYATVYQQGSGAHTWYTAPSGTAGNPISFTQSMMLDASGNFGLGVTPQTWSIGKAIQVGSNSALLGVGTETDLTMNAYFNSGWKYITSGAASFYSQSNGAHSWSVAPTGTAGNPISFTQAMTLDASGNLLVGTTSAAEKITVNGAIAVTGAITGHGANRVTISQEGPSNGAFIQSYGPDTSTVGEFNFRQASSDFSVSRVAAKIDTSGNLLVGTTIAFAKLAVNGSIYAAAGNDIQVGNVNNTNAASISSDSAGTAASLVFKTAAAGLERVEVGRFDPSGNLLVGTTSNPTSAKLVVEGKTTIGGALHEKKATIAASDIDVGSASLFTRTITANTTFTVSNVPASGVVASFILDLTNGGSATVTWWAGVKWAGGTAPALTASGRDVLGFFTHDGGTTWTGMMMVKDAK